MEPGKVAGLVGLGSAVKSLGGNRIGGHLVLFGSPAVKDSDGQFFTRDTDFWGLDGKRPAIFHHGFSKAVGRRKLGDVTLQLDELGVRVEGELEARDEHEKKILSMVKAGKLGWSSGSAPHLVEIGDDGAIKSWPIVEASVTPTPADARTRVVSLKSMVGRKATGGGDAPATLEDLERYIKSDPRGLELAADQRARLVALARRLKSNLAGLDRLLAGDDGEAEARAALALSGI